MFKTKILEHHFLLNHRIVIKAICDNHNITYGQYHMPIHIIRSLNCVINLSHN